MIDLTGHYDVPVPEEVLAELAEVCKESNVEMLVIGAAARDLVIHSQQQKDPIRATDDVDIAVAVRTDEQFLELAGTFARRGKAPHKFKVLGVEVDIVPFGGNEADRTVTFTDGNLLDVTGLQEAHLTSPSSSMRCLKVHSMMRSGSTTRHLTLPMPTSSQRQLPLRSPSGPPLLAARREGRARRHPRSGTKRDADPSHAKLACQ